MLSGGEFAGFDGLNKIVGGRFYVAICKEIFDEFWRVLGDAEHIIAD